MLLRGARGTGTDADATTWHLRRIRVVLTAARRRGVVAVGRGTAAGVGRRLRRQLAGAVRFERTETILEKTRETR